MKNYKVDLSGYKGKIREALSVAIQEKAFELGYEWESFGKEAFWIRSSYLFFNKSKVTHFGTEDERYFENHSGIEIKAADFLSLTQEEQELKPFDRVLVRDFDSEEWRIDFYSHRDESKAYQYQCLKSFWHQCIPYEGNEHLLGTTRGLND